MKREWQQGCGVRLRRRPPASGCQRGPLNSLGRGDTHPTSFDSLTPILRISCLPFLLRVVLLCVPCFLMACLLRRRALGDEPRAHPLANGFLYERQGGGDILELELCRLEAILVSLDVRIDLLLLLRYDDLLVEQVIEQVLGLEESLYSPMLPSQL